MNNILDANVILRYLLDDVAEQADAAEKAIREGAICLPEVLAEVVYVLDGVYKCSRSEIAATLQNFLEEIEMEHKAAAVYALRLYGKTKLDFVDCLLAARAKVLGENIITFDKDLIKAIGRELPER